ncbi:ferrous iron transport protein B [Clostridium luticellarii]|jgi:ferrous iron transport protein B|uniref:Ferrous iron transport protein B n=1 Tax=Clostridium luticellarii TaxID=1691940 RepID=A0A2T0BPP0_9CLOT|nr:ferrous iron transport protein B [Clostridium luticellarii]MCI1944189.1 ferrous iron transport protein B [Clostridium luticellarii]MCI1967691.1 ferrous iron transport protein B [Clostridium luticellarii]MCI1994860.1 ferrous iron transport protein B [Clostridium luticellarii]MCI2039655.1 ferrous iron transport protein B [Clostridium luticellarii]PRR85802.1 Ferrous iron transport protein B [Clostridium luticellarii]
MSIKIALAGNPNSGKTTMFNDLTGSSQYVGNWPGVTVEKKEGRLKGHKDVIIQDLPGIYSLSPYTLEEVVSRNYLINEKPDSIIDIVDGSNIERNLYLATQLVEIGVPVVMALNMIDVVRKNGDTIDIKKLGDALGCEVIETSALKGIGSKEVAEKAIELARSKMPYSVPHIFSESLEKALAQIENIVRENINKVNSRWISIKLFERDEKILEQIELRDDLKERIENIISSCEKKFDDDSESIVTNERYAYINKLIKQVLYRKNKARVNMSDRIDKIVTNRILALPIFVAIMFLVYYFSISTVGGAMTDWVNDNLFGDFVPNNVEWILNSIGTADWLNSFILDGIIAGVGAVLGFVPQMAMLFLCLAILEDCGYMARIAFIMDRLFRRFGLSGKSFIPILIGTGCGVPGIMSTRTIENEKDRRMTVIVTTFIPCSAKIPIIALIAGALFHGAAWVATSAYFIGIAAIIISGIILKKTKIFSGDPAPFIMELPPYHVPGAKGVLIHMWERSKAFMKKAGTVILLATVLVWFLSSFNWRMQAVDMEQSILASIGNVIAPIFAPLGWGNWKAAVASLTGLMAKENVVGTFGILYGFSEVAEDGAQVWGSLQSSFSLLGGYSLLVFNLLCAPCFAAMGAVRTEMNSRKWTLFSIGYQCVFAYVVSLIIFQIGSLVTGKGFGIGTAVAVILIIGLIYLLFKRPYSEKHDNQVVGGSIREKEVV